MSTFRNWISQRFKAFARTAEEAPIKKRELLDELAWVQAYPPLYDPRIGWLQYNPSLLVQKKGLEIYDAMRRDDQIKAALQFKKLAVLASGWEVKVPDEVPKDYEPKQFVEDVLTHLDTPLDEVLRHSLGALDYGYSIQEKIYHIDQDEYAGRLVIKDIRSKKPHSFGFAIDEFGNMLEKGLVQIGRFQLGNQPPTQSGEVVLPPHKFLIYTHQFEFGNYYGVSDLEAAYRPWWIKENAYKWLAQLLQRLGIPPVLAKYDSDTITGAAVDALKQIVQNLQGATAGVIPVPGGPSNLEFWTPELANNIPNVFAPALDAFNRDIARAILMPGLLGMTPDQQQGSFARARVQFDVFMLVIEQLRAQIEQLVQRDVVQDLVNLNFPPAAIEEFGYPEFKFLPLTDEVRLELLTTWSGLVTAGVVTKSSEDEDHIRQLLKFPNKQDTLTDQEEDEIEDEIEDKEDEPGEEIPGDASDELPEDEGNEDVEDNDQEKIGVYFAKTEYDRQVNYAKIKSSMEDLEAKTIEELKKALQTSREKIIKKVEQVLGKKNKAQSLKFVQNLHLPGFSDVQEVLGELLRRSFEDGGVTLREEVNAPKKLQQLFTTTEALRWLQRKRLVISGVLSDKLTGEAKRILMDSVKYGEPEGDTVSKLWDLFEPYVGDESVIDDGELIEPHRLSTIVRTNLTEAYNFGRWQAAHDPDVVGFIDYLEYSAVLDEKTTEICRFLHGKLIPIEESESGRLAPPNHFNCRSLLVPVPVGVVVNKKDIITKSQIGKAKDLIPTGFK